MLTDNNRAAVANCVKWILNGKGHKCTTTEEWNKNSISRSKSSYHGHRKLENEYI